MGVKRKLPPWVEHAMTVRRALQKRGFKMGDAVQICEICHEMAEETWQLRGSGMGGRDLMFCAACGRARSWRGPLGGARTCEEPFDLMGFLGLKIES